MTYNPSKPSSPAEIRAIVALVACETGIRAEDIVSERRQRSYTRARHLAMWVARKATGASYPRIGNALGGRDHSSVINAMHRVEMRRQYEPHFATLADRLLECVERLREQKAEAMRTRADQILDVAARMQGEAVEVLRQQAHRMAEANRAKDQAKSEARKRQRRAVSDSNVNWGGAGDGGRYGTQTMGWFMAQNDRFCAAMDRAVKEGEPLPRDVVFASKGRNAA